MNQTLFKLALGILLVVLSVTELEAQVLSLTYVGGDSMRTRLVTLIEKDTIKGLPGQKLIIRGNVEISNKNDADFVTQKKITTSNVVLVFDTIEFEPNSTLYSKSNLVFWPIKYILGEPTIVSLRSENGQDGTSGLNLSAAANGLKGKNGIAGRNGRMGAPGENGRNGENGSAGSKGGNGEAGFTAISVVFNLTSVEPHLQFSITGPGGNGGRGGNGGNGQNGGFGGDGGRGGATLASFTNTNLPGGNGGNGGNGGDGGNGGNGGDGGNGGNGGDGAYIQIILDKEHYYKFIASNFTIHCNNPGGKGGLNGQGGQLGRGGNGGNGGKGGRGKVGKKVLTGKKGQGGKTGISGSNGKDGITGKDGKTPDLSIKMVETHSITGIN